MFKKDQILKAIALLAFIIIGCAFLSRSLNSSKTLYEYALENPELAYGEDETAEIYTESESPANNSEDIKTTVENDNEVSTENSPVSETLADETSADTSAATEDDTLKPTETSEAHPDRFTYAEGFYSEPITPSIEERIVGISYPADGSAEVSLNDLAYLSILYNDFEGGVQTGELICNQSIALDLLEIFEELYRNNYQFEEISLIDEYGGDDTLSMEHNNTSCFNYRIVDGTDHLSKHAYGLAIDINPFYNPYVVYNKDGSGETYISPQGSEAYADRSKDFPYKIDENDLCYKLFMEHGFTWGGNWNSSKDYQHFQKAN